MSGTKKVLNFIKMCGHTKSHLRCRFCIEEAEPTGGNVAQAGRNNDENERTMEVFAVEGQRHRGTRRNEANAKIFGEQERAQEILDTMGATSCGHSSPSFECSECEPSLRSYRRALRRSAEGLDPWGGVKRAQGYDALQGATVMASDLEEAIAHARAGDGVYFDPPYVPRPGTSPFTVHAAYAFTERDHVRLSDVYCQHVECGGVHTILSNSDCAFTKRLCAGLDVERVQALRAINLVSVRRGIVGELLVVSPAQGGVRVAGKDAP